jgi:hypothetical protein
MIYLELIYIKINQIKIIFYNHVDCSLFRIVLSYFWILL